MTTRGTFIPGIEFITPLRNQPLVSNITAYWQFKSFKLTFRKKYSLSIIELKPSASQTAGEFFSTCSFPTRPRPGQFWSTRLCKSAVCKVHLLFSRGESKILTPLGGVPPGILHGLPYGLPLLKSTKITFRMKRYKKRTWEITFSHHIGYRHFWGPFLPHQRVCQ